MWPLCSPMLALEMLSPIAVTETTEVTTGRRRGGDGWVGGWGGSPLSFGYLPKASGKDTGCGRRPYLKGDGRAPAEGGLCWRYVGLSWTYLGPMLPLYSPMLAICWPMSALCWPKLALSCPYVGLMVAYVGAMLA